MVENSRRAYVRWRFGRFWSRCRNSTAWSRALVGESPQKPWISWNDRMPMRRASASIFVSPRRLIIVLAAPLSEYRIIRSRRLFSDDVSDRWRTDDWRRNVSSSRLLIVDTPRTGVL